MTQNTNHLRLLALSFIVGSSFVTAAYAAKSTSQCEEELGEKASNRNLVMECLLEGNKDTPDEDASAVNKVADDDEQRARIDLLIESALASLQMEECS